MMPSHVFAFALATMGLLSPSNPRSEQFQPPACSMPDSPLIGG